MGKKKINSLSQPCPCGSGHLYQKCCSIFHEEQQLPNTAEQLMRSRYSAYAFRLEKYLFDTWHPDQRPKTLDLDQTTKWIGLTIISTKGGQPNDTEGWVEFKARYKENGKANALIENSRFLKIQGRWLYHSGKHE